MRFAIYLPTVNEFADVRLLADLARAAEESGWDGVFVWDVLSLSLDDQPWPQVDAWAALSAIAAGTSRVRIGPIVEAVARRRPWKLARETVSVDRLSRGRLTLGVGLGADPDAEFAAFGEDPRARTHTPRAPLPREADYFSPASAAAPTNPDLGRRELAEHGGAASRAALGRVRADPSRLA